VYEKKLQGSVLPRFAEGSELWKELEVDDKSVFKLLNIGKG
jgi:hypothetical protein